LKKVYEARSEKNIKLLRAYIEWPFTADAR